MAKKKHVHKYFRRKIKDAIVYACADPDCFTYTHPRNILGKRSICHRCGKEFILPLKLDKLLKKPHCKACTKSPNRTSQNKEAIDELIDNLFG